MKKLTIPIFKCCFFGVLLTLSSCEKFLDEKPNVKYAVPSQVSDLQALLDYYPTMNNRDAGSGEISADDYFLTDGDWEGLANTFFQDMYTWQPDNLFLPSSNEWSKLYEVVFVANTVLDGLEKISAQGNNADNVRGQALVFRAESFLRLAEIWTLAYDENATSNLGIPLRLTANFNELSKRSTLEQTYKQIIQDLQMAVALLPNISLTPLRPSKAAAYGYLSRTYFFMRDYSHALSYADSCMQLKADLMDYNSLDPSATYPFSKLNEEVIMECYIPAPGPLGPSRARISPDLLALYDEHDLRKRLFFKASPDGEAQLFKGSYEGGATLFSGLATDELMLIHAEGCVRLGRMEDGLHDLNELLKNRYDDTFKPLELTDKDALLRRIWQERRKELVFRGLRWPDIKRLNKEGNNIMLSRTVKGEVYRLEPNDLRYALPLPEDIIALSGMEQNPR
ncbi:hypothetical protein GCM10023231_18440 [Olivibacter ginsenosidimutans]|uniref:RagB/SusD family nutrient uptake outer membrane protein n=1 Tax=Olivibacter ginsenosidimutans TaxID=1176537 RepID=A0ABP9B6Y6_9SPHI